MLFLDVEGHLLESVYVYLMEGKYQEGVSVNQKRVVRKKAANFRIINGEMIFKKMQRKRRGIDALQPSYIAIMQICS